MALRADAEQPLVLPEVPGSVRMPAEAVAQMDICTKCGLCLSTCPTYLTTGRESDSPRGRIALAEEVHKGLLSLDVLDETMAFCLHCRACETVCPSGVHYTSVLTAARTALHREGLGRPRARWADRLQRRLTHWFVPNPWVWRLARAGLGLWRRGPDRLARRLGLLRMLPGNLAEIERALPDPWARVPGTAPERRNSALPRATSTGTSAAEAATSRGSTLPATPVAEAITEAAAEAVADAVGEAAADAAEEAAASIAFFRGCVSETLFGPANRAAQATLVDAGCRVHCPAGQTCCGALHMNAGDADGARRLARRNIEAFERSGGVIVNTAGGCGAHMKEYPHLFADDDAWRARAEAFSARVRDYSEVLAARLAPADGAGRAPASGTDGRSPGVAGRPLRVGYLDSCHLRHGQGVSEEPRAILAALPGVEPVELAEPELCCGSAAVYTFTHPGTSAELADRKAGHVKAADVDVVVVTNPGCDLQMRWALQRNGLDGRVRVMHLAELVARQLGG